jgi:preprotein translocase subunit Sec63
MPDTFIYLLLGYGVMFGLLVVYALSWWVRARNLEKDLDTLRSLDDDTP